MVSALENYGHIFYFFHQAKAVVECMCSARSVMTVWRECINQRKDQIVSTMHFELISSHNLPAKQSYAFIIYLIEETNWFDFLYFSYF